MNPAVVECVKHAQENERSGADSCADDGADIEDRLLLSDRTGDFACMTEVSFSEGCEDVECSGETAEDDKEGLVRCTDVGDENDGSFFAFVLAEVVSDGPNDEETDNGSGPKSKGENGKEVVDSVIADLHFARS